MVIDAGTLPATPRRMRTFFASSALLFMVGCGTDPDAANAQRWSEVVEVSMRSFTHGVAGGSSACTTSSSRYDLREHVLVDVRCAAETRSVARPQDSADLLAALRGIVIVDQPCNGYDGVDTSVTLRRSGAEVPDGFALGWTSCSGGATSRDIPTITSESWQPVLVILDRIRAAR